MMLGRLIKLLEGQIPENECLVLAPKRLSPGSAHSYRGYYDQLAFDVSEDISTVAVFLGKLRDCVGKTFTGYKGGEYLMDLSTQVWISEYAEAHPTIVSAVEGDEYQTWIKIDVRGW